MQTQKCDCFGCDNELRTFDEVMSNICDSHRTLLEDDDNYAGVCWNCCRVTIVGPRRNAKGKMIIPDKYIFSKSCRHCSSDEHAGIDWMTIKADSVPTSYVRVVETERGPRGKILPITENIKI